MDLSMFDELKGRFACKGMGKPALVGIVAVIILAAAVAAWRLAPVLLPAQFEVTRASADTMQDEVEDAGASIDPVPLFVHVSGAVRSPGLCELQAGARVADAVNAAGGFAEDARQESVNLARSVQDGEQIIVASQTDVPDPASADAADGAASGVSAATLGLVNVNTAGAAELVSLPGIGEATAAKIVADREANGPFGSVDDLRRVSGIGEKKLEAISGLICV